MFGVFFLAFFQDGTVDKVLLEELALKYAHELGLSSRDVEEHLEEFRWQELEEILVYTYCEYNL